MIDLQKIYSDMTLNYFKEFMVIDLFILSIFFFITYFSVSKINRYIYRQYNIFYKLFLINIKVFLVIVVSIYYLDKYRYLDNVSYLTHNWIFLFLSRILLLEILNIFIMRLASKKITFKKYLYILCFSAIVIIMFYKFISVYVMILYCIFVCDILKFINQITKFINHINFINFVHICIQTPAIVALFIFSPKINISEISSFNLLIYYTLNHMIQTMIVSLSLVDTIYRLAIINR